MPGLRRRTLLRALLAGSLAGGVAGCNGLGESDDDTQSPDDSGGDAPTPPPGSPSLTAPTAAPSATGAATPPPTETTPASAPTPAPTATAPPTPSPAPTPSPTPDSETRTALTFVERFVAGEFDRAHDMFTDGFATDLTAARLERYFLGLTAQHGAVEHVADVSDSRRDGTDTRVATLACAAGRDGSNSPSLTGASTVSGSPRPTRRRTTSTSRPFPSAR